MIRIPLDPNGYSVNLSTGTVHTRYPGAHAGTVHRTSDPQRAVSMLNGREPNVCGTCYPVPVYPRPPKRSPQRRRVAASPDA